MLNFINKKGQKVMELHDNGEVKVLTEDMKKSFEDKSPLKESKQEENKDNE